MCVCCVNVIIVGFFPTQIKVFEEGRSENKREVGGVKTLLNLCPKNRPTHVYYPFPSYLEKNNNNKSKQINVEIQTKETVIPTLLNTEKSPKGGFK